MIITDTCWSCGKSGRDGHSPDCALVQVSGLSGLVGVLAAPGVPFIAPSAKSAPPLLPTDGQTRKEMPIYSGVVAYFPRALGAVAYLSFVGNEKHNPGQPLHWSRGKSNDHKDCIMRHLIENGTVDPDDGFLHDVKLAWRALANLELVLENLEQEKQ